MLSDLTVGSPEGYAPANYKIIIINNMYVPMTCGSFFTTLGVKAFKSRSLFFVLSMS
jgi:hypothetical protein